MFGLRARFAILMVRQQQTKIEMLLVLDFNGSDGSD